MEKQIKHIGLLLNKINLLCETDSNGNRTFELSQFDSYCPSSCILKTVFLFLGFDKELRQYFIYSCACKTSEELKQYIMGQFYVFTTLGDHVLEFYPLDEGIFKQTVFNNDNYDVFSTYCGKYRVFSHIYATIDAYKSYGDPTILPFGMHIIIQNIDKAANVDEGTIKDDSFFLNNGKDSIHHREAELLVYRYCQIFEKEFFETAEYRFDYDGTNRLIHELEERLREAQEHVDQYNLKEILKDLEIEIEEYFIHKIGDNDTYIAEIKRTIGADANYDEYLKNYIKLGKHTLTHSYGYCSAESMKDPSIKEGKYSEEEVEAYRTDLIRNYSKISHMNAILAPPEEYSCFVKKKNVIRKIHNVDLSFLFINYSELIRNYFFRTLFHHKVKSYTELIDKENSFLKDYTKSFDRRRWY